MRVLIAAVLALAIAPLAHANEQWRGLKWLDVTLDMYKLKAAANGYNPEHLIETIKGEVFAESHRRNYKIVSVVTSPKDTALFCIFLGAGSSPKSAAGVYFVMNTTTNAYWTSNFCRY